MNKYLLRFVLLPVVFFLSSCGRDGCPMHSGSMIAEVRDLPPFDEIILHDKINLVLTQDSIQQVRVSAGKNLLSRIQTSVSGNALTIQDNNSCNLLRDPSDQVNVYISSRLLQKITYYGAGNVNSTNTFHVPAFTVDCWQGSGTITLDLQAGQVNAVVRNENATIVLTGSADAARIYCGEAGSVDLLGLIASQVSIDHNSIRDISVHVSGKLQANIVYKGNVYYKGSPAVIDTMITGAGRLIHL